MAATDGIAAAESDRRTVLAAGTASRDQDKPPLSDPVHFNRALYVDYDLCDDFSIQARGMRPVTEQGLRARPMKAVRLITGFLLAGILGGVSLAPVSAQTQAVSESAQTQTEPDSAKMFNELRHSRITTVNAIAALSRTKQADEQNLSLKQDQMKALEQSIATLPAPPMKAEDYDSKIKDIQDRIVDEENDLSDAKAIVPVDQKHIDDITRLIALFKGTGADLEARKASANDEIKQYEAGKADLTNKLSQAKSAIDNLNNDTAKIQNDIDEKTQALQEIEDKIAVLFTDTQQKKFL